MKLNAGQLPESVCPFIGIFFYTHSYNMNHIYMRRAQSPPEVRAKRAPELLSYFVLHPRIGLHLISSIYI